MPNCTQASHDFPALSRKKIQAQFNGGEISSDGGVLLLREADRRLNLMKAIDQVIPDPRDARYIEHTQLSLLRQRVYGLALGYEDLNDHQSLRGDPALQTAVDQEDDLGSPPTLCRLENRANRQAAVAMHQVIVDQFIDSFETPPEALTLDFDATDDPLHGEQENRFYQGYYRCYCYLPLYVFCGDRLLVSYLRPSNIDGAKHAWAILALLVKRLRQSWPQVKITFRGDSGFCRHRMLSWCERHNVDYIVGMAKNARLLKAIAAEMAAIEQQFAQTRQACRQFKTFQYGARAWQKKRTLIGKAEHLSQGANPRFIISTLEGDAQHLYEKIYCARGDMENRIKEQQLGLFADRTSCHHWWPNQLRLLLSSLAYILIESIRRVGLKGTQWVRAQVNTVRLKFLKVGAVILRNTRRIRFLLSENYPNQDTFFLIARQLQTQ